MRSTRAKKQLRKSWAFVAVSLKLLPASTCRLMASSSVGKKRAARGMVDDAGTTAAEGVDVVLATHPGDGVTAKVLSRRWKSMPRTRVLGFYGHGPSAGEYACFSNFYDQSHDPFTFVVPEEFCNVALNTEERETRCAFSEKAIMLCKAAVMGDRETYGMIQRCSLPKEAKALGRQVDNFNSETWDRVVCKVAYEAVHQKFQASPTLGRILLRTGEQIIAEATRNDKIWGIGINVGDERVHTPSLWLGSNILGWALMEVRDSLAKDAKFRSEATRIASCESEDAAPSSPKRTVRHYFNKWEKKGA